MNMAKEQGRTGLIVTIVALGLTLVIVGTIVILQNLNRPAVTDDASKTETSQEETKPEDTPVEQTSDDISPDVDPATLNSIDIEPLAITVFYTKGTPGFDFAVKRAADRTQYVEFSSPNLVGTKCTNDEGVFASIIKNSTSSEDENAGTTKQKVGNDTYELALVGPDCTSDVELLKEYQSGFSNGFSQLKAIE